MNSEDNVKLNTLIDKLSEFGAKTYSATPEEYNEPEMESRLPKWVLEKEYVRALTMPSRPDNFAENFWPMSMLKAFPPSYAPSPSPYPPTTLTLTRFHTRITNHALLLLLPNPNPSPEP